MTLTKYVYQYSPDLLIRLTTAAKLTVTLAWVTTSPTTGNAVLKTVWFFNNVILSGLKHDVEDGQTVEKLSFAYAQLAMAGAYNGASGLQTVTQGSWNAIDYRRCGSPDCPAWIA